MCDTCGGSEYMEACGRCKQLTARGLGCVCVFQASCTVAFSAPHLHVQERCTRLLCEACHEADTELLLLCDSCGCADALLAAARPCPKCREPIARAIRVFED